MAKPHGTPNKRKSLFVQRTILTAIRQGNTLHNAARLAGIDYSTLCRWRRLDATLNHAVQTAEGEAESLHVNAIVSAGVSGHWQASAWWLERRRTGDWRKPADRLELADIRRAAEETAAEIGQPHLADAIERDILISIEAGQ
jgi:hypothetical protein